MKENLYFPTLIKTYDQNGLQEINALAQGKRNLGEDSLKVVQHSFPLFCSYFFSVIISLCACLQVSSSKQQDGCPVLCLTFRCEEKAISFCAFKNKKSFPEASQQDSDCFTDQCLIALHSPLNEKEQDCYGCLNQLALPLTRDRFSFPTEWKHEGN